MFEIEFPNSVPEIQAQTMQGNKKTERDSKGIVERIDNSR
jgi:hypothetical protein